MKLFLAVALLLSSVMAVCQQVLPAMGSSSGGSGVIPASTPIVLATGQFVVITTGQLVVIQ